MHTNTKTHTARGMMSEDDVTKRAKKSKAVSTTKHARTSVIRVDDMIKMTASRYLKTPQQQITCNKKM